MCFLQPCRRVQLRSPRAATVQTAVKSRDIMDRRRLDVNRKESPSPVRPPACPGYSPPPTASWPMSNTVSVVRLYYNMHYRFNSVVVSGLRQSNLFLAVADAMPINKYQEFIPHTVLQTDVKRFWILEKEYTPEDNVEEVVPDACIELILNF